MPSRSGLAAVLGGALSLVLALAAACSGSSNSADGGKDSGMDAPTDGGPGDGSRESTTDGRGDAHDAMPDVGSGPALLELALSTGAADAGDAGAPVTLFPAFNPTINDYYVLCAAGMNSFELSMAATPGATSQLTQPTASPAVNAQTLSVSVAEGAAMVAVARKGSSSVEYWVRCLPHDFPKMNWTLHPEAGAPTPGYYLLGNQTKGSGAAGYAMILDQHGVPVWFLADPPGIVVDVDDVVPGAISFLLYPQNPGQIGIHTLSPPATQYIAPNLADDISRHELRYLSNGHYLVILPPNKYGVDMTGATLTFLADGGTTALGPGMTIQDCQIVEFDDAGTVYWSWTASDHMDVAKETVSPLVAGIQRDGGLVLDPIHCNSIDLDPTTENAMLVSAKCTDSVSYVDRVSKKILWKMGGTPFSKDGAAIVPVSDRYHSQHDARFQKWSPTCGGGGTGSISVFDDQTTGTKNARGVVYDVSVAPHFDAPTDAGEGGVDGSPADAGTIDCGASGVTTAATRSYEYSGMTNSTGMGSFRILADGSRVIGWGQGNLPDLVFTEVDDGNDVLDFYFTQGFTSYRVIKVPTSAFDLETLRRTAGQ